MTFCSSTFRHMCSESTCQLTYWRKLMQRRSRYTQPSSWSLFLFLLQTPHVRPTSAPGDAPESAQEDLDLSGEEKEPAQGWLLYLETDLSSQTFWLQRITNNRDDNMKWINFFCCSWSWENYIKISNLQLKRRHALSLLQYFQLFFCAK